MFRKKLRDRIWKEYRLQVNFANAVQVDPAIVSLIINRKRPFTKRRREEWAKLLNCKPEDLVD